MVTLEAWIQRLWSEQQLDSYTFFIYQLSGNGAKNLLRSSKHWVVASSKSQKFEVDPQGIKQKVEYAHTKQSLKIQRKLSGYPHEKLQRRKSINEKKRCKNKINWEIIIKSL